MLFSGFNNFSHVNISECFKHSLILGEVEEFIERKKNFHITCQEFFFLIINALTNAIFLKSVLVNGKYSVNVHLKYIF